MGRTAGLWLQDSAFPDGQIFTPANTAVVGAGAVTNARSAKGLIVANAAASQTVTLDFILTKILRFGMQDDGQQAFGSASGTGQNANAVTAATPFATYLQQSGRPPYTQAQNLVVPTKRPKGLQINSVVPIYTVATLALTSVSIGVTKTVFTDLAAPVVTDLLAAGANGLRTAVSAQPNAIAAAITTPAMLTDLNTELIAELTLVLPATSTATIYGLLWNVSFNYN